MLDSLQNKGKQAFSEVGKAEHWQNCEVYCHFGYISLGDSLCPNYLALVCCPHPPFDQGLVNVPPYYFLEK